MNAKRLFFLQRESSRRASRRVQSVRHSIAKMGDEGAGKLISWLLTLALICASILWTAQPVSAKTKIFVPSVTNDAVIGAGEQVSVCALNEEEAAIAQMMESDPGQKRSNPVCDPILAQVARARARDMALRSYFSHTNPDGVGPNKLARDAGFALPDWYSQSRNANNIESIGGGYQTPEAAWQGWLNSSAHRTHVLGIDPFYGSQNSYGVGFYFKADAPFKYYWVFISAPTPGQ